MALFRLTGRRTLLKGLLAAGAASTLWSPARGQLQPTPACDDGDEPTPEQTEGPFFSRNSPERSDLREPGMAGTPIALAGLVVSRSCRPVPGALVELWHADDSGEYDNEGFRLRGHQFTGADGGYRFETIVPGLYPGRTRHFHLKFQAPGESVLTTQFYFPGEPGNQRDRLFRPELVLSIAGRVARYETVLDMA